MPVLYCAMYIAAIGIAFNFIGNAYPRERFRADRFPYRAARWEQGGKIYRKIGVQHWKDYLPDMSKIVPNMYRKEIVSFPDQGRLARLIQEACVAECVHWQLMLFSAPVIWICPGPGGWIIWGACILGNLVFVIIQRYNRPRLYRALQRMQRQAAAINDLPAESE